MSVLRKKYGLDRIYEGELSAREQEVVDLVRHFIIHHLPDACKQQSGGRGAVYEQARLAVPTTGYCYLGAQAVWMLLGGLGSGYIPAIIPRPKGRPDVDTHWFVIRTSDGLIIDPTSDQFQGETIPYDRASDGIGRMSSHLRGDLKVSVTGKFTPDYKTSVLLDAIKNHTQGA